MQSIALLLPELEVSDCRPRIRSERAYVVSLFVEKLNSSRGQLKPLTASFIAFKMSHLSVPDLYAFYKICDKGIFSKVWWGALRAREDNIPYRYGKKNTPKKQQ